MKNAILVVTVIILGLFLMGCDFTEIKEEVATEINSAVENISLSDAGTTYENSEYGINVSYPISWHERECISDSGEGYSLYWVGLDPVESNIPPCESEGVPTVAFTVPDMSAQSMGTTEYIDQIKASLDGATESEITLDEGQAATKITGYTLPDEFYGDLYAGMYEEHIVFFRTGYDYHLRYVGDETEAETTFQEIIESIQFE